MTTYGFIGVGNMGRILIESFVTYGAIASEQVVVFNRTDEKSLRLRNEIPNITIAQSIEEVIQSTDVIFLCVKPLDMLNLLQRYGTLFNASQTVVSITSPLDVHTIAEHTPAQVVRMIPSITNRVGAGCTLLSFHPETTEETREHLHTLASKISTPVEIDESFVRITSDIVSCGPAFISWILQEMIDNAASFNGLDRAQATTLVSNMMIGFGKLIAENHYSLETLQQKVCVKGGITGEGIIALENQASGLFRGVYTRTHNKFHHEKAIIKGSNTESL
ncbi:MAG: late competence protein ComER [Bacilli bacterium]